MLTHAPNCDTRHGPRQRCNGSTILGQSADRCPLCWANVDPEAGSCGACGAIVKAVAAPPPGQPTRAQDRPVAVVAAAELCPLIGMLAIVMAWRGDSNASAGGSSIPFLLGLVAFCVGGWGWRLAGRAGAARFVFVVRLSLMFAAGVMFFILLSAGCVDSGANCDSGVPAVAFVVLAIVVWSLVIAPVASTIFLVHDIRITRSGGSRDPGALSRSSSL